MRDKKNANAESLGAVTHTHTHFMFTEKKKLQFSEINKERGITLVALVVTIIVIIILATVSINAVFSENGIIKKAQLAKDMQANSIVAEEEDMNRLLEEYANMMASELGGRCNNKHSRTACSYNRKCTRSKGKANGILWKTS